MALFHHPEQSEDQRFMLSVYNEYVRLMYFTARKYVPESDRQNDIVQESLTRLIRNVPTLRGLEPAALSTYIVTTVKNTAINFVKKEKQMRERTAELEDESLAGLESPEPPLEDLMAAAEDRERLREVLENLSENERLLLERKYFLGHSDRELAKFFQCKPESIRMKLTRARRHMVSLLQNGKECDGDDKS